MYISVRVSSVYFDASSLDSRLSLMKLFNIVIGTFYVLLRYLLMVDVLTRKKVHLIKGDMSFFSVSPGG